MRVFTKRSNLASWQAVTHREGLATAWSSTPDAVHVEGMRSFMLGRILEWATTVSRIPNLFDGYIRIIAAGQRIVFTEFEYMAPPIQSCAQFKSRMLHRGCLVPVCV